VNEPLDRNKTEVTHRATAVAAAWLSGIGCKMIETEVPLGSGWVADLATWWSPTMTEARRSRLLRDMVQDQEAFAQADSQVSRLYRMLGGRITIAVEVKTSRADFMRDAGRKYTLNFAPNRPTLPAPAHMLILAATEDAIREDKVDDWGVLRISSDGSRVLKWRGPWKSHRQHPYEIEDLIAAVAERRDNVTRYAAARRWFKAFRAAKSAGHNDSSAVGEAYKKTRKAPLQERDA
jgi:hypothetical protein